MYNYLFSKYRKVRNWPAEWGIDVRHAKLLHNLIMHAPIKTYAEIGCAGGVSTTAAIESLRSGKALKVHLCDLTFTPPLLSLVSRWEKAGRIKLHCCESQKFLRTRLGLDFVFLDGDHSLETVKSELDALKRTRVRYIAAHDTSALERALAHGMPERNFNGPAYLREQLQCLSGWHCLEERKRRPGEATVRGFFFATNDRRFFDTAQKLFRYWADIPYSREYNCRYDPDFGKARLPKKSRQ